MEKYKPQKKNRYGKLVTTNTATLFLTGKIRREEVIGADVIEVCPAVTHEIIKVGSCLLYVIMKS